MNTVLRVGVLLLFALAVFGSAWYIAFRLRTTLGLRRRWLLRVLVLAALVGSFMSMVPATKSADLVAGLSYVFGGYVLAGYVFLTLAFVLLHVIERAWHLPKAREDSRTIKAVLASLHVKDGLPSVLLQHSPAGAQHAAANGIDLMIAGHTHGGQFFPGTLVAAAMFPFTHGLYHRGPLQVFVSQGAGTYMSRVRLGTSNELNLLRLRPKRSL